MQSRARHHGSEQHPPGTCKAASSPAAAALAVRVTTISAKLLVTAVVAGGPAPALSPTRLRMAGISATRVKIRTLCARATRGRSAALVAASTRTEDKAPGMEA
jgi:hypothetical protein